MDLGRGVSLAAEPAPDAEPPKPSTAEVGISGTTNWNGDPLAESNTKLIHSLAYGVPGGRTWGEWQKLANTDPDISAVLDFICSPVRGAEVNVEPAKHPSLPEAEAAKHADFVRWCILENCEPRWPDILDQMSRGPLTDGFSLHEVVLGVVEHQSLPGGVGYGLRKLAERLPVSVHAVNGWRESAKPGGGVELETIVQNGQHGARYAGSLELPASKVLLNSWKRRGGNYRGVSAFRAVWWHAKAREEIAKMLPIVLLREGQGIPTIEATGPDSPDLVGDDRKKLEDLLANMVAHENANIIPPKGWQLKWIFSGGADKKHILDIYNGLGLLILRQLGAQQMALGTGDTGSRSVGEVHLATAQNYIQSVVAMVESTLNGSGERPYTGLTRKLVEPNWGKQPAYPRITITLQKNAQEPAAFAAAAATAITSGAVTWTLEDENKTREHLGLSPIEAVVRDAERALRPTPQAQPPAKFARTPAAFSPSRPLRPSEKRLDLTRMSSFLNSAREEFEASVRPLVVKMLRAAEPDIREAMADGDPSDMAELQLDTEAVEKAIADFIDASRAEGAAQVRKELSTGTGDDVARARSEGAQDMAPVRLAEKKKPTARQVDPDDAIASTKSMLLRKLTTRLRLELENEALDALRTGAGADSVIERTMTRQEETGAFRGDAGAVLTRAWNLGRDEAARLMGADTVEYSAILDGKQCTPCDNADGKTAGVGTPQHDSLLPPNKDCAGGSNCRCVLVYVPGESE